MSQVMEPTLEEIDWEETHPPCEMQNKKVPCDKAAEWAGWNLACSCDPEAYFVCTPHKEKACSVKFKCELCQTRADMRWDRL